ncbi:MAG: hypothetical protein MUP49_07050 [Dehalococcoidia bacterium]|nr:hypothetical protein [Dehalococcoidia bacterium]
MGSVSVIVITTWAVALVVGVFFYRRLTRKSSSEYQKATEYVVRRLEDTLAAQAPRVSIADKKKEAIQKMGPKTFYYLDESQVKDLYLQVIQEPELKRIQTRETKEVKGGITGKFPMVEPKYERGKAQEVTKDYDVEQVPAMRYNKVEQFFFDKGKVIFGLDEFEFDKSSIDDFESICDQMRSKFNLDIPDDLYATFIVDKMREFALEYIKKLASSSGYIALQSEFLVIDIADNDCILSRVHPLNLHLQPEDKEVRIQICCARNLLTPSGIATFKKDKSVKITSLGKVVSWNDEDKILEVSPIAIY